MSQSLGARIRAMRASQEKTLAVLASDAGVSVSYLNDIEHDRTVPSLGKLQSIATALGTNVRAVLDGVAPYDD